MDRYLCNQNINFSLRCFILLVLHKVITLLQAPCLWPGWPLSLSIFFHFDCTPGSRILSWWLDLCVLFRTCILACTGEHSVPDWSEFMMIELVLQCFCSITVIGKNTHSLTVYEPWTLPALTPCALLLLIKGFRCLKSSVCRNNSTIPMYSVFTLMKSDNWITSESMHEHSDNHLAHFQIYSRILFSKITPSAPLHFLRELYAFYMLLIFYYNWKSTGVRSSRRFHDLNWLKTETSWLC